MHVFVPDSPKDATEGQTEPYVAGKIQATHP